MLLLHAGMHRTGSTDLQILLEGNRAALAARGVAYPGAGRNHQDLAWALIRGEAGGREVAATLDPAARVTVLSAEDFFIHRDLKWLEAAKARTEVRVRVYLRRQDDWLMSWYNQHVKWPFHRRKSKMSPERFLDAIDDFHWLDFDATLARWEAALGPGAVEIAPVERGFGAAGQVEDVVADFLARLGLAGDAGVVREVSGYNDGLPPHVLEIARHLGLFEMGPRARLRVNEALREGLKDKATPARTVFPPDRRNAVLDRFEAGNRAVARRFLAREALFLGPRPGPDEPFFALPEMDRETLLREWIAPVVKALAEGR